ncbi:DUF2808 domain-containing protein [Lyngbya confervoides]|uniref:DUF2808 domain-containing protein n=1 Tax=Lyngbya confervoides BDU141951 TaxID=1574623 RepID=A0ABD4T195_9CYAN|nr:DUF2808 domain-containing protein [Lyngbya confervoides]MCM1982349.1 DUF2808 domain-containing protein [Lyngbya confervoides BDU141951]
MIATQRIARAGLTLILSGSLWGLAPLESQGVQLRDGTVYFDHVPRLGKVASTISQTHSPNAIYYFHIDLPAHAGESLKTLEIEQREGVDSISFNLRRTRAYLGRRRGPEISVQATATPNSDQVTVTFPDPISPGQTVILALKPYWNPSTDGIYLFGVKAIPDGPQGHPQFLGYGRLHFYNRHFPFGWGHW